MKILLIDDVRTEIFISITYGIDVTDVAKDYSSGIGALKTQKWDLLLLDHDLSSYEGDQEKTGYDVLCFLEANPEHMPKEIFLVTSNPVGRQRMQSLIERFKQHGYLR